MLLTEHKKMCPLRIEDPAVFVSSHKWPRIRKFSCHDNCLKQRSGGIHADRVWPGPEELWIAGLTALVIHLHFKRVPPVYLTGCNFAQQSISNVDGLDILGRCPLQKDKSCYQQGLLHHTDLMSAGGLLEFYSDYSWPAFSSPSKSCNYISLPANSVPRQLCGLPGDAFMQSQKQVSPLPRKFSRAHQIPSGAGCVYPSQGCRGHISSSIHIHLLTIMKMSIVYTKGRHSLGYKGFQYTDMILLHWLFVLVPCIHMKPV